MKICIATQNAHKVGEFAEILENLVPGLELCSLADFPPIEIDENGLTYAENACIKARAAFAHTGLWCLGDDSGFEVEALDWGPGLYSARYAKGRNQIEALLGDVAEKRKQFGEVPSGARFRCALCLAAPTDVLARLKGMQGFTAMGDDVVLTQGMLEGRLAQAPRGAGGFGYDPICEIERPNGTWCTVAELPEGEKHQVSHRGRATLAMAPILRFLIENFSK